MISQKHEVVLSILVVSHNQETQINRCLNSILKQNIKHRYEIIISDDASTDNSWNIINEYSRSYPEIINCFQINSSIINPITKSERCGYNKANAYLHANGEYFVFIDADDFLIGEDIYQTQIDMLGKYRDCIMCMQNVVYYKEDNPPSFSKNWFDIDKFEDGKIITAKEYILNNLFIVNPAFMIRRINSPNPAELLGKNFNDSLITLYHLQFGKIVFLKRTQYAYVISPYGINASRTGIDREVFMFSITPYKILLIPKFAGILLRSELKSIKRMMKMTVTAQQLKSETINWLCQFQGFSFRLFACYKLSILHRIREMAVRLLSQLIDKFELHCSLLYKFLFMLLVTPRVINKNFDFNPK